MEEDILHIISLVRNILDTSKLKKPVPGDGYDLGWDASIDNISEQIDTMVYELVHNP